MSETPKKGAKGVTTDEQIRFLMCYITHQDGGKVDWNVIAQKFDTTAGAASKRFSRLMVAYKRDDPTAPGATGGASSTPATPKSKTNGQAPKTPGSKKRKIEAVKAEETAEEDGGDADADADT